MTTYQYWIVKARSRNGEFRVASGILANPERARQIATGKAGNGATLIVEKVTMRDAVVDGGTDVEIGRVTVGTFGACEYCSTRGEVAHDPYTRRFMCLPCKAASAEAMAAEAAAERRAERRNEAFLWGEV